MHNCIQYAIISTTRRDKSSEKSNGLLILEIARSAGLWYIWKMRAKGYGLGVKSHHPYI